jgi:hypothetical protein
MLKMMVEREQMAVVGGAEGGGGKSSIRGLRVEV